jgi:hypothetical protein
LNAWLSPIRLGPLAHGLNRLRKNTTEAPTGQLKPNNDAASGSFQPSLRDYSYLHAISQDFILG